jgi:hypothetical protein
MFIGKIVDLPKSMNVASSVDDRARMVVTTTRNELHNALAVSTMTLVLWV